MSTAKKSLQKRELLLRTLPLSSSTLQIKTKTLHFNFLPPNLSFYQKNFISLYHETRHGSVFVLRRLLLLRGASSSGFVGIYQQSEFSRWVCVRNSFFCLPGDALLLLQTDPRKISKDQDFDNRNTFLQENQFEGAVNEGNKGESIWDTFTKKPGIKQTNPEKNSQITQKINNYVICS